jgi:RimJ/RimL family protein N-acetyltransferase
VFDYPFNQAKVKRITGLVGEGNIEARKFDEHIGFKLEARLAGAHPTGDLLIYVMRREDCRFLRAPYANIRADLLRAAA